MDLNLIQFNEYMKELPVKPPINSDSFYTIKNGTVSLFCIEDDKYVITIRDGEIYTGPDNFYISANDESLFKEMIVNNNSTLSVERGFTIIDSNVKIYGSVKLNKHSRMYVRGSSKVHFAETSHLYIDDDSDIIVEKSADVLISGEVNISKRRIDSFTEKLNIKFENSSIINIKGLNDYNTYPTLNSYLYELTKRHMTPNSINEKVYSHGDNIIGYKWVYGDYDKYYQIIDMFTYKGNIVLGNLKILFKGKAKEILNNHTGLNNLYINKKTVLHIVDKYEDREFIRSKLYIGGYSNGIHSSKCIVNGKIICKGKDSSIILDKNGLLDIKEDAEIIVSDNANIICDPSNTNVVLNIEGTLIIDYIEQIDTFKHFNISFGKKGKIIILNPSTNERRYLFATPVQIKDSAIYKILLEHHLNHIEYHINKNTGIRIDKYYEFYGRDMKDWFGNKRIEQCIKDKIIIWDDGFIELDRKIIPWVNIKTSLLEISKIFKCFGSKDIDRLQNMVNRLIYAGSGNIIFRIISDMIEKELLLDLTNIDIQNVYYDPIKKKYVVKTYTDGIVFLRNNTYAEKLILSDESKKEFIIDTKAVFEL